MNESDDGQEGDTKCKQKNRGKKRKRVASESSSDDEGVLPENILEMEKNLHASAIKNNLDDISVKKILKKVVTNDHVLALVKLREEEEEEDSGTEENLQPKITRAKAKQLMKVSLKSAPWNLELTPIKHIPVKTRPEVKALIAQELPEDEDDEEYEPTNDDVPSDDDHMIESSSDVDSLPRTPATPRSLKKASPEVVNDGPFKVPQQGLSTPVRKKLVLEEEATIALRTRSKLSLSATSIEHIESSFVPPDDLPMPDVDSLWNDFLKGCLNPTSNARNEEDDEADPEYNVAADPDANEEDEESLENSIIKISKKELNDLVTELFSIIPDGTTEQLADNIVQDVLIEHTEMHTDVPTHWEGKQEPESEEDNTTVASRAAPVAAKENRFSIGKCEPEDEDDTPSANCEESHIETQPATEPVDTNPPAPPVVAAAQNARQKADANEPPNLLRVMLTTKPDPIRIEIQKNSCTILPEQLLLLQQQLRQHVQFAASNYLQLFVHPTHWARAPIYKEYLESFEKMVQRNPTSVVNVCNLKPALELMTSWETAVSTNTKENLEMVEFVQKEMERGLRRSAQNAYYVGDFPELFLQVVANSPVFLYPALLPGAPFRADIKIRRAHYLKAEDEYITLGLDQFWDFVCANPELYKKPAFVHPRHRWGLAPTLQLICKYMLPWVVPKTLLAHVRHVKKGLDKDNPIYKFFQTRKVDPVKHRLLSFNPQMTLYEQPEHEMPRLWIRYLAKNSNRFKKYLYGRHKPEAVPNGVDIDINVQAPTKTPLPIDFNKKISCKRLNLRPKQDEGPAVNRIDVPIQPNQPLVASELFTVLNTSTGSFLVPLGQTLNPTSAAESADVEENVPEAPPNFNIVAENAISKDNEDIEGTKTAERSYLATDFDGLLRVEKKSSDHCTCCVLIRKMCKRKKTIADYFKGGTSRTLDSCRCKGRRYPRMTNRLRLLLNNYRLQTKCVFDELQHKLKTIRSDIDSAVHCSDMMISDDDDEHDLATATLFQLKLTTTTVAVRNNRTKNRINSLFSSFDIHSGNVLELASSLYKVCEEEIVGLYKEFVGFLTAEQADKLGHFKDYFIQRCMEKLVKKIEELVPEKQKQCAMLKFLKSKFFTTAFQSWSACDICTALLQMAGGAPALAQYVFSLFPHTHMHSDQKESDQQSKLRTADVVTPADNINEPSEAHTAMDYEMDHSSSSENSEDDGVATVVTLNDVILYVNKQENTPVKVEIEEINVHDVSRTETSNDALETRPYMPRTETSNDALGTRPDVPRTETSNYALGTRPDVPRTETSNDALGTRPDVPRTETSNDALETRPYMPITETSNDALGTRPDVPRTETSNYALGTRPDVPRTETSNDALETRPDVPRTSIDGSKTSLDVSRTETSNDASETTPDARRTESSNDASETSPDVPTTESNNNVLETTPDVPRTESSNDASETSPDVPGTETSNNASETTSDVPRTENRYDASEPTRDVHRNETSNDASETMLTSDEAVVKTEAPEWKRDEDKLILEVLKQHITPVEREDKSILEILEETQALAMISDSLQHKSIIDIRERILYLLRLLVNGAQ